MKILSFFLLKISNWRSFISFFILYLAFNIYFLPEGFKSKLPVADKDLPILDLQMGYNPQRVKEIVSMYSGEAKEAYILGATITDSIYPLVYFTFFGIILSLIYYKWRIKPLWPLMNLLPLSIILFDYLENYTIVKMLNTFPGDIESLAIVCSTFTSFKWLTAFFSIGLMIFGLLKNFLRK